MGVEVGECLTSTQNRINRKFVSFPQSINLLFDSLRSVRFNMRPVFFLSPSPPTTHHNIYGQVIKCSNYVYDCTFAALWQNTLCLKFLMGKWFRFFHRSVLPVSFIPLPRPPWWVSSHTTEEIACHANEERDLVFLSSAEHEDDDGAEQDLSTSFPGTCSYLWNFVYLLLHLRLESKLMHARLSASSSGCVSRSPLHRHFPAKTFLLHSSSSNDIAHIKLVSFKGRSNWCTMYSMLMCRGGEADDKPPCHMTLFVCKYFAL